MTAGAVLPLIDAMIRGALLALLLLSAWRFARDHPALPLGRVGVVFMLGLSVQVIASMPAIESNVACVRQSPAVGISVANSVLFWLFALALFVDGFRVRAWHVAAWIVVFAIGTSYCAAMGSPSTDASLASAHRLAMRWAPALFAALAIVVAVRHWRDDLVELRRGVRRYIVIAGSIYTVVMVAARLASRDGRLEAGFALLDTVGLLVVIGVAVATMLRFADLGVVGVAASAAVVPTNDSPAEPAPAATAGPGPDDVTATPAGAAAAIDEADSRLHASLERAMATERVYRAEDLSVASLASRLSVPEYRLRRVINQRLGHRNFNAFVNGWRLAEAKARLADPSQRDLPILTIALESGFQSIGPFNRAFKADTGTTPSDYRRQHGAGG